MFAKESQHVASKLMLREHSSLHSFTHVPSPHVDAGGGGGENGDGGVDVCGVEVDGLSDGFCEGCRLVLGAPGWDKDGRRLTLGEVEGDKEGCRDKIGVPGGSNVGFELADGSTLTLGSPECAGIVSGATEGHKLGEFDGDVLGSPERSSLFFDRARPSILTSSINI